MHQQHLVGNRKSLQNLLQPVLKTCENNPPNNKKIFTCGGTYLLEYHQQLLELLVVLQTNRKLYS
jgi:hypothetical protein